MSVIFRVLLQIPQVIVMRHSNTSHEVEIAVADHIKDIFLLWEAKTKALERFRCGFTKTYQDNIEESRQRAKKKKNREEKKLFWRAEDNSGTGSGNCIKTIKKKEQTNTKQTKKVKFRKWFVKDQVLQNSFQRKRH